MANKTVKIVFRTTPEFKKTIYDLANNNFRNVSNQIVMMLQKQLDALVSNDEVKE